MKLQCFEATDSNGTELYLFQLEDNSFISVPKERLEWKPLSPEELKEMKGVDSEVEDRPQGKWIEMYRNGFGNMICMCSKCSFHASRSRYCPNCGADMKGVDDE